MDNGEIIPDRDIRMNDEEEWKNEPSIRPMRKSNLGSAFQLFNVYFNAFGIDIFNEPKSFGRGFAVHAIVSTIMASAFVVAVLDDATDFTVSGYDAIIHGVMNAAYILQAIWTYSAIFWKQKELRAILKDMQNIAPVVVRAKTDMYNTVSIVSRINVLVIIVQSAIPLIVLVITLQGEASKSTSDLIFKLILYLFIMPNQFIFITFLLFICYILTNCFHQLKLQHRLQSNSGHASRKKLEVYISHHSAMSDIVVNLNELYGDCFAFWNASELVMFIFSFRLLDLNLDDPTVTPESIIDIVYPALYFTVQSLYVSNLNQKVIESLKGMTTISKLKQEQDGDDHFSNRAYEETANKILLYIHHVMISPPEVNGKGLFTVEKTMILGVAGTSLIYILTLYGIKF